MSIKSGFFNSRNGDRVYNADDLNHFFEGIISDGVFKGYKSDLKVEHKSGMTIRVLTGKAICHDKYVENTSALDFNIEGGNALPRIDAVVVAVNLEDRNGYIYVKQGVASSTPTPPTLYNNANTKEIALAYIYVGANATAITADNITDKRNDSSVCGWVKLTNVSAELITYRNIYTTSQTEKIINIGITDFNATTDTLFVFKNGMILDEATDYLIQGTGSDAKIHLAADTPIGNKFTFIVEHLGI